MEQEVKVLITPSQELLLLLPPERNVSLEASIQDNLNTVDWILSPVDIYPRIGKGIYSPTISGQTELIASNWKSKVAVMLPSKCPIYCGQIMSPSDLLILPSDLTAPSM